MRAIFARLCKFVNKGGQKPHNEEDLLKVIDRSKMPRHVAIIMDGNGRWAQKRGLPRAMGHRAGVESLRDVVKLCSTISLPVLTVYAFSTENWKRPREEINILMNLLVEYLTKELEELHRQNVKIKAIGKICELPEKARRALEDAQMKTDNNTGLQLNLALNYGGRNEITKAVREIAEKIKTGQMNPSEIDEQVLADHMYTAGLPDPDLLIRPSGEQRWSNFLLWQGAYAEFWVTPVHWPDFRRIHLLEAINDYQQRHRRFGGLKGRV